MRSISSDTTFKEALSGEGQKEIPRPVSKSSYLRTNTKAPNRTTGGIPTIAVGRFFCVVEYVSKRMCKDTDFN